MMIIKRKHLEIICIGIIFLIGIWLYTIPTSDLPFGDVDAATHFGIGDYAYTSNKPVSYLPIYLDRVKGHVNDHKVWYPPQFHHNIAVMQVIGGHRILSPYILIAIESFAVIFSIYVFIRRLYGFIPAILSSFGLLFSLRDISIYLWSQWPQAISYSYLPLILYSYYRYTDSIFKRKNKGYNKGYDKEYDRQNNKRESKEDKETNKENNKEKDSEEHANLVRKDYLILTALLLALQYYQHPQGMLHSIAALGVISLFIALKNKKMPFKMLHAAISLILLAALLFPMMQFTSSITSQQAGNRLGLNDPSRLFYWFKAPDNLAGLPESYYRFSQMYSGYWMLPLLFLGIAYILIRRKPQDLFMAGWLVSLYILLHVDVIGLLPYRVVRVLGAEQHLFYPLIALGACFLITLLSSKRLMKKSASTAIILSIFIIMTLFYNADAAVNQLNSEKNALTRINHEQYKAADWMRKNTNEDIVFLNAGSLVYHVKKWIYIISQRSSAYTGSIIGTGHDLANQTTHVMFDYSQLAMTGNKETAGQLLALEKASMKDNVMLYNGQNIRIYRLAGTYEGFLGMLEGKPSGGNSSKRGNPEVQDENKGADKEDVQAQNSSEQGSQDEG